MTQRRFKVANHRPAENMPGVASMPLGAEVTGENGRCGNIAAWQKVGFETLLRAS